MGEPYMVIPTRYNREALVYPDLDTLISNNIPNATVEAINITFTSSETVAIQRLKSSDIVITFKEEVIEYKKGDNWVTELFGAWAMHVCCEVVMLAKGFPNRNMTRAHTDLERLLENLKRRNISDIIRIRLRHI